MIGLLLTLAAIAQSPHQPPRFVCTEERTGRRVQAQLRLGWIAWREGRRWRILQPSNTGWSCLPADGRRYPVDPT